MDPPTGLTCKPVFSIGSMSSEAPHPRACTSTLAGSHLRAKSASQSVTHSMPALQATTSTCGIPSSRHPLTHTEVYRRSAETSTPTLSGEDGSITEFLSARACQSSGLIAVSCTDSTHIHKFSVLNSVSGCVASASASASSETV